MPFIAPIFGKLLEPNLKVPNDNVRERAVNLAGVVPFPTAGDLRDHGETGAMATTTGKHVRFTTGATRTSNSKWRLHKGRPEPYPTVVRRPLSAVATYKVDAATAKYLQQLNRLDDDANRDFREAKQKRSRGPINGLQLMLMIYLLMQWGPVSYELGVALGSMLIAQATMGASLWA